MAFKWAPVRLSGSLELFGLFVEPAGVEVFDRGAEMLQPAFLLRGERIGAGPFPFLAAGSDLFSSFALEPPGLLLDFAFETLSLLVAALLMEAGRLGHLTFEHGFLPGSSPLVRREVPFGAVAFYIPPHFSFESVQVADHLIDLFAIEFAARTFPFPIRFASFASFMTFRMFDAFFVFTFDGAAGELGLGGGRLEVGAGGCGRRHQPAG